MPTLAQLRAELALTEGRANETITFIEKLNRVARTVKKPSKTRRLADLRGRMMAHAESQMTRRNSLLRKIRSAEKKPSATRRARR